MNLGAKLQSLAIEAKAQILPATSQRSDEKAIMLLRQRPEGIQRGIRGLIPGGGSGEQGWLIAKAGEKKFGKDQDPCAFRQGCRRHLQCSGEVFLRMTGLYGKLEASGSHTKKR
jgi:hypothetical protein